MPLKALILVFVCILITSFYFPVIPDDIHICGACRKQFSDVEEFVLHKKHGCPVLLSLQTGNQLQTGSQSQSGVTQSTVRSPSLPAGNQVIQNGTQSLVTQSTVSTDSLSVGHQLTQSGPDHLTIPQPGEHTQGSYSNQLSLETRQDVGVEDQYQVPQVSSTGEVGAYNHVTGNGLQTNQNGEYVSAVL